MANVIDSSGNEWRPTQGGNWRNVKTGALSRKNPNAAAAAAPTRDQQILGALNQVAGKDKTLQAGFAGGQTLGNLYFNDGSMGRIDKQTYDGTYVPDELKRASAAFEQNANTAGTASADMDASMKGLSDYAMTAGNRTPEMQAMLDRRMAALGGLGTEEGTAIRENAQADMNTGLSTALRSLKGRYPGATGAAGSLAAMPALGQFAGQSRGLARDMSTLDANMKRDALNGYSTDLQSVVNAENARKAAGWGAYNTAAGNRDSMLATNKANAMNSWGNWTAGQDARNLGVNQWNLGQKNAETAGQLGMIWGGGNFAQGKQTADQAYDLGKKQISAMS